MTTRNSCRLVRVAGLLLLAWACLGVPFLARAADGPYQTADDAYSAGARLYNMKKYAESREPFEAALKLAPDDKYRFKVYQALLASYRQLEKADKFVEAADFILTKSQSAAERSLMRRDLLGFVHQRGKTDELAQRYEDVLKKDAKNVTALYVLSELYSELKRDPKRSAEMLQRLATVQAAEGKALDVAASAKLAQQYVKSGKRKEGAELYENIAPLDPKLSAWHWKEAATTWLAAGDKDRALAAAKASAASIPEKRSELLTYFWHRALGDVFLDTGEPALAVEQFEAALKNCTIDGYIKDTQKKLDIAKQKK